MKIGGLVKYIADEKDCCGRFKRGSYYKYLINDKNETILIIDEFGDGVQQIPKGSVFTNHFKLLKSHKRKNDLG